MSTQILKNAKCIKMHASILRLAMEREVDFLILVRIWSLLISEILVGSCLHVLNSKHLNLKI